MLGNKYDFIVVGSGPAGAAVASRLASCGTSPSVLLVEAGIAKDSSNANILADRWSAISKFPSSVENHTTQPQRWLNDRPINYARGKVLGGSSAVNMCAYTVGPKDDYDRWATIVGDESFGWDNVVRLRKGKIEAFDADMGRGYKDYASPDMSVHGEHGALAVSIPRVWEKPMVSQLNAAKASGLGLNLDINSGNPLGLASVPSTAKNGLRITAANAYLENAPSNLYILTEQQVVKVVLENKRAIGVQVAGGDEYYASKEVVLSAGAVDTPKLLMLSGIGNASELAEHSIETLHGLPGVGKCLQDHLSVALCWRRNTGDVDWPQHFSNPDAIKKAEAEFLADGTGPFSVFFQGLIMGFFKAEEVFRSEEFEQLDESAKEHLRKETVPIWELSSHIPACTPSALAAPEKDYLTAFVFLHNSQSRGTVSLSSPSPSSPPRIDPQFFSHPFDRLCAVAATQRALAFFRHPLIASKLESEIDIPASDSDKDILDFWEKNAASTWHPSCTVKMGIKRVGAVYYLLQVGSCRSEKCMLPERSVSKVSSSCAVFRCRFSGVIWKLSDI